MSVSRIKKNDTVISVAGASKGSSGKVLQVITASNRALVEGVNLKKKCLRKSQDNPQGGISDIEASIGLSNLMPYCPECKKGVKISRGRDGEKNVRKCRLCGHSFDV